MVSALSSYGHVAHQSRVIAASVLRGTPQRRLLTTAVASGVGGRGLDKEGVSRPLESTAVNFHFTRKCKFCFHVNSSEFLLPLEQQCNIIRTLRAGGAEKINFAGGEPFLYARELGELVKYGGALDILGLSIDTQYSSVNFSHGRWPIKGILSDSARQRNRQLEQARRVRAWCAERGIKFKVNTVVTALNADEDMSPLINELRPMRWKVFQVLPLEGENCGAGKGAGQDVLPLLITHEQFQRYIERNAGGLDASLSHDGVLEAEDNDTMKTSYVLVDERGCFLDSSGGGKKPTRSILDVGLSEAFRELQDDTRGGFDRTLFVKRNGYYPERWSRSPPATGAELV